MAVVAVAVAVIIVVLLLLEVVVVVVPVKPSQWMNGWLYDLCSHRGASLYNSYPSIDSLCEC